MDKSTTTGDKASNSKKGNGSNTKKGKWKGKGKSNNTYKDSFKGDCDELKGKVYYIGSNKQTDNCNTTTEAILEYFLRTYTHGLDVVESLEDLQEKDFSSEMPVMGTPATGASDEEKQALKDSYKEEMKQFVGKKECCKQT